MTIVRTLADLDGKTPDTFLVACRRMFACCWPHSVFSFFIFRNSDPDKCDNRAPDFCGCPECTLQLLETQSVPFDFSCGDRIASLRNPNSENKTEVEACTAIAFQFPECGEVTQCDPAKCNGGTATDPSTNRREREGAPWAWAVLGANVLFCIIIFIMYRKW